jgi:hypothetical protein
MKNLISFMLLAGALVIGASMLSAKPLSRIIRDIGLTPDDFTMMSSSAETLYATASPRPGKVVSWINPDSKSHGTAKLAAMRDNCAFVQHFVFPKGDEKSKEIRLRFCKQSNGAWVLQP